VKMMMMMMMNSAGVSSGCATRYHCVKHSQTASKVATVGL